jgi:hypothetical protein
VDVGKEIAGFTDLSTAVPRRNFFATKLMARKMGMA